MYRRCKLINIVDCYKNITIRANTIYNFHVQAFRAYVYIRLYVYNTRSVYTYKSVVESRQKLIYCPDFVSDGSRT